MAVRTWPRAPLAGKMAQSLLGYLKKNMASFLGGLEAWCGLSADFGQDLIKQPVPGV